MTENKKSELIKIKFRGQRTEQYRNTREFPLKHNDIVVVEADRGEDIGHVVINTAKSVFSADTNFPSIIRKASPKDISNDSDNRINEQIAFQYCRNAVIKLKLELKLIDVESRLDMKKMIFYFTAEKRIDFRNLVKILASEYKTRIEMRQISSREELKRFNGIGPCGREICCRKFIENFTPISTQLVKDQNLPMNPTKISGYCGKLKCCFNYEHESYRKVLEKYPSYGTKVKIDNKKGFLEKIDIFSENASIRLDDDQIEEIPLKDFDKKVKILDRK